MMRKAQAALLRRSCPCLLSRAAGCSRRRFAALTGHMALGPRWSLG
jgi:hypothetical protein